MSRSDNRVSREDYEKLARELEVWLRIFSLKNNRLT